MNQRLPRLLIVDDNASLADDLRPLFERRFHLEQVLSGEECLERLKRDSYDLLLVDLGLGKGMSGDKLIGELHPKYPELPVIILTKDESFASARKAVQADNVLDYLPKSMGPRRFVRPIQSALIRARHRGLVELHRRSQVDVPRIVGRSSATASIREVIERAGSVDSTVLVTGETGAGKEVVARHIHLASARREHPFLTVDCPVLHDDLVQSELFGHVKGAFTGADRDRRGQIELAAGGTLFLDEIGDLEPPNQAKLLRFLDSHSYRPLGGDRTIHVDVRVIAATHRDLEAMVASGKFRADLMYRLQVLVVRIPPLRERVEDIAETALAVLDRLSSGHPGFTPEAEDALRRHAWPGNVRELQNRVERALIFAAPDSKIDAEHLALSDGSDGIGKALAYCEARKMAMAAWNRRHLAAALARNGGHVGEAAKELGLATGYLYKLIAQYGVRGHHDLSPALAHE